MQTIAKKSLVLGAILLGVIGAWVSVDSTLISVDANAIVAHAAVGCDGCDGYGYNDDGSYYYDTTNYDDSYYYSDYDYYSPNYGGSNNYYYDSGSYADDYSYNLDYGNYDNDYGVYDLYGIYRDTTTYDSYDYYDSYNYNSGYSYSTPYYNNYNYNSGYNYNYNYTPPPAPPANPTCTIWATPSVLNGPTNVTIYWDSSNATSGWMNDGGGALNGAAGYVPGKYVSQTTTFTATFYNSVGASVNCSTTVFVQQLPPPPPPQNNPPTCTLTASPNSVTSGNYTTLSWTTSNATSVSISNIGSVSTNGSNSVQVFSTQNYTLTASGAGGTVTCNTSVGVLPTPPQNNPPSCTLIASPNVVTSGNYTTLTWTTNNATSVSITNLGSVAANGSNSVLVSGGTQTFTLTASGPGGSVNCQTTVVTNQIQNNAPFCTLSSSPTASGGAILFWNTNNATSAYIDQGVGNVYPVQSGSYTVGSSGNRTYTMTVSGPGGSANCQTTINTTVNAPSCSLFASQTNINSGQAVNISWISNNTNYGSIDNGIGSIYPVSSGSRTVYPTNTTTYNATFNGQYGSINCFVVVTVNSGGGVVLYQNPNNQPLASVFLSQIPYTGFEAGPALTFIFWLAIALLSALIAYFVAGQGAMRGLLSYVLGGVIGVPLEHAYARTREEDEFADEMSSGPAYPSFDDGSTVTPIPEVVLQASAAAPAPAPVRPAELSPLPDIGAVVESRAHAAGVLMSPEAVALAIALAPNRADALRIFGDVLNNAVRTLPREDGWIMLTADRFHSLRGGSQFSMRSDSFAGVSA